MKYFIFILTIACILHTTISHIPLNLQLPDIGRFFRIGRNIFVGDPKYTQVRSMPFDPYQSDRLTGAFQKTYGFRGENLVHAIGAGYSMEELKRFNAVS